MLSNQQIGQNLQEIRKSIRPKINAATFYNQYLKLIPVSYTHLTLPTKA